MFIQVSESQDSKNLAASIKSPHFFDTKEIHNNALERMKTNKSEDNVSEKIENYIESNQDSARKIKPLPELPASEVFLPEQPKSHPQELKPEKSNSNRMNTDRNSQDLNEILKTEEKSEDASELEISIQRLKAISKTITVKSILVQLSLLKF